jgi:hypothetical protein
MRTVSLGAVVCALLCGLAGIGTAAERVQSELNVLYDFRSVEGGVIRDVSGLNPSLDLRIADPKAVQHTAAGLEIVGPTLMRTEKPAARLIDTIKQSGSVTLEAWIRPADLKQNGPARIVTLSRNPNERNFTLGQDGDKVEVRLRTTTSRYGSSRTRARRSCNGPARGRRRRFTLASSTRSASTGNCARGTRGPARRAGSATCRTLTTRTSTTALRGRR